MRYHVHVLTTHSISSNVPTASVINHQHPTIHKASDFPPSTAIRKYFSLATSDPHRIPANPFIGRLPSLSPLSPYQPINPTLVTPSSSMDATRTKMAHHPISAPAYDLLILIPRVRCFGLVRFTFAQHDSGWHFLKR